MGRALKANDEAVVQGSEFPDWMTPYPLRAALEDEFGFDIDLAANAESSVADSWLGPGSNINVDALRTNWFTICKRATGFLNPPYSRELSMAIDPWIEKCWEEAQRGFTTVSLVPHRPDTRWWRTTRHAAEIREIPHRVPFLLPVAAFEARNLLRAANGKKPLAGKTVQDGDKVAVQTSGAGFPSALLIWRPQPGVIGPALPRRITWDYLNRSK